MHNSKVLTFVTHQSCQSWLNNFLLIPHIPCFLCPQLVMNLYLAGYSMTVCPQIVVLEVPPRAEKANTNLNCIYSSEDTLLFFLW